LGIRVDDGSCRQAGSVSELYSPGLQSISLAKDQQREAKAMSEQYDLMPVYRWGGGEPSGYALVKIPMSDDKQKVATSRNVGDNPPIA
jgi:hypothetical protein